MKNKIIIFVVLLLAFFLRFWQVTEIPPALNWDETSIGYNAYSILKTGKDEWGEFLPLHFKSFGEYKLPVQLYATIPGVAIFGLNELGVRILPVLYGTASVLLLYVLAKELFSDERVALISALLLAISPWHIQLTRASFESSFSVFWVLMGIWLLVRGFEKPKWWIVSAIPFVMAVYTYNSARAFVPLFLLSTFLLYRKKIWKNKREFLMGAGLFAILLIPLAPFTLRGEASARYKLVSITDDAGLIPRIEERRNLSTLPPLVTKLIHNRPVYVSVYFLQNYLAHFTPDFLFVSGAGHSHHHVQGIGELYLVQAPFLIVGAYMLLRTRHKHNNIIFPWLLLTFIPVSLTNDSIPHALRTAIATPVYQILTAVGLLYTFSKVKKENAKILMGILVVLGLAVGFSRYVYQAYKVYPSEYSRDWQYGYKQVVGYTKEHYDEYDKIVITRGYGEPHMFTLFWMGWDPAQYQNDPALVRFESHDWVWVNGFDKFYFPDLGDAGTGYEDIKQEKMNERILFVGKPGDFPDYLERLYTVDFLNGDRAFEIVEYLPNEIN